MASDLYTKELRKVLTDETPARPTTAAHADIERDIAEITTLLKGPLSNVERLCLVEDRQHLRKQLAAMNAP